MGWILLTLGIFAEIVGTVSMKLSEGFTKLIPSISIFVFYGLSLTLVTLSLKKIDISIAYSLWAGLGTAIVAVIGFIYFKEHLSVLKVCSIILIVLGVVGLNLGESAQEEEAEMVMPVEKVK